MRSSRWGAVDKPTVMFKFCVWAALVCHVVTTSSASLVKCVKTDIDARREVDQGFGLAIDARKLVECDELDLSISSALDANNKLLVEGARELASYLAVNQRLKRLKVAGNFIGDEGAVLLADALRSNNVLESLWLGRNNISDVGVDAVANALQNPRGGLSGNQALRELRLDFNRIENADSIASALDPTGAVCGLRRVDLAGNALGDSAATALADALVKPHQQVEELVLSFNQVGLSVAAQCL